MSLSSPSGVGPIEHVNKPICWSFGPIVGTVPAAPVSPRSDGAEGCQGAGREPSSPSRPLDSLPGPDGFSRGPLNDFPRICNGPSNVEVVLSGQFDITFANSDDFNSERFSSVGGRIGSRGTISFGKTSGGSITMDSGTQITPANKEPPLLKDSKVPTKRTNWRVKLRTISNQKRPTPNKQPY